MSKGRKLLFCFFLACFVLSSGAVICLILQDNKDSRQYAGIRQEAEKLLGQTSLPFGVMDDIVTDDGTLKKQDSAEDFYARQKRVNSDYVGWLRIPGTGVSYPVAADTGRTDKYLDTDFYGRSNPCGCLFRYTGNSARYQVVYGHHMRNGSMFGGLKKYKSQQYFAGHPQIEYITDKAKHVYRIFAVVLTTADADGFAFDVGQKTGTGRQFLDEVKARAIYQTNEQVSSGERILVLATCEYSRKNGRIVLFAHEPAGRT